MKQAYAIVFILLLFISLAYGEIIIVEDDYSNMNISKADIQQLKQLDYTTSLGKQNSYGLGFYFICFMALLMSFTFMFIVFVFGIVALYLILHKLDERKRYFK
jgi:hypothetical protein